MTEPRDPIDEIDLLAYVDDLLDPSRRAEVEAFIAADPDAAERIRTFQAQRATIRHLYDPVLDEPVPERLRAVLDRPPRRFAPALTRLAAALALTLAAGYGGWWLRGPDMASSVEALLAQARLSQPSAGWVEASAGTTATVAPPDLSRYGYVLARSSRHDDAERPLMRFDYDGPDGPLSLFLSSARPGPTTPMPFAAGRGTGLYWIEGLRIYALTGPKEHLAAIAESVRSQMTGAPAPLEASAGPASSTNEVLRPQGGALEMLQTPDRKAAVGQL